MAYVCLCNQVTDREVVEAVHAGACSVDGVMQRCQAGGDCGSCHVTIEDLIAESMGSDVAVQVLPRCGCLNP